MGFSLPHIAIVACVAVLLFGSGKISALMGDVGKGISSFKQGLKDDDPPKIFSDQPGPTPISSIPAVPVATTEKV